MDINVFAKSDEIPSLPVQDSNEKPKCCGQRITITITLTELVPSPYFSIKNVHLVDVFAKFYEIPPLPFQDIEKPKCGRRTDRLTDGQMWKQFTHTETQFAGVWRSACLSMQFDRCLCCWLPWYTIILKDAMSKIPDLLLASVVELASLHDYKEHLPKYEPPHDKTNKMTVGPA